jgi:hypothetical protein
MYDDATTNALMNKGIYSVHYPEEQPNKWWTAWKEHNILSGMWYVFILSCLLWWLPVFGQMIAGYIGGRRAGSPTKGLMVAIIPVFIIMLLFIGMDIGVLPFLVSLAQLPSMVMNGIQSVSPSAASYINGIFEGLAPLVGLNANGFLIVVVFGLIGGMMADLNKKEISKATGGGNMFGGFSPASLHKLADMVAERVMWTMGTMETGGRNLISASHSAPREMGFADLKMLPASTAGYEPRSSWQEPVFNDQSASAFGYEDPYLEEEGFDTMENLIIEPEPADPQPREDTSYDDDWGITHYDLTDEHLTEKWIAQNKNMDSQKPRKKYGKTKDSRSERLYDNEVKSKQKNSKRDAKVYNGKGKVIESKASKPKKKAKSKSSSLIDRAMEADKKIESKQKKKPKKQDSEPEPELEPEIDPQQEVLEQILAQSAKPRQKAATQAFERL